MFLKISIDEDMSAWRSAIIKLELAGPHTCFNQGWEASVAKQYGVNAIPAYFLIDRKGNIAIKDCPRPSEADRLATEIDRLLQ